MLTQISTMRWKTRSSQPPKKPWAAPAKMPMRLEMTATTSAKSTEMRKP